MTMMIHIVRSVVVMTAALVVLGSGGSGSSKSAVVSAWTASNHQHNTNTNTNNNNAVHHNNPRTILSTSSSRGARLSMASSAAAAGAGTAEVMPLPNGSLVALATPMTTTGEVDTTTLRALLRWHKAEGTKGVVILGTTGEASTLSVAEKHTIMEITCDELKGTIPIVVGTGTIDTKSTIAATLEAQRYGADAALVVTPYYVKPSQQGLIAHFTAVADAVEQQLPIILYNVPGRTGVDLSVESTVTLAQHPMIQGIKDATGDNNRVEPFNTLIGTTQQNTNPKKPEFKLYSGEDGMAREFVAKGGHGVISVTANVAPKRVSQIMELAGSASMTTSTSTTVEANLAKAKALDQSLQSLHRDLFCEANPIPVKWALYKMGKTQDGIRLPLTVLGTEYHARIEAALLQGACIESTECDGKGADCVPSAISYGWPAQAVLLQGQLFDTGLINQVLELIEKRGGDFEITNFSVQPNDQFSNADFNFKRPSSVAMNIMAVDATALTDIVQRLQSLVDVIESADGVLTVITAEDGDVPDNNEE